MTKRTESTSGTGDGQGDARNRRHLSDPDVVLERLADVANDFDEIRALAVDLDNIRQEQLELLDQVREELSQAAGKLAVLNGNMQTAEVRLGQIGISADDAVSRYAEIVANVPEQLQQMENRAQQVIAQSEKTFKEWRTTEDKRVAQWREQTEAAFEEYVKALSRNVESSDELLRSTSDSLEQALDRIGMMERTYGTHLTDLRQSIAEERASRMQISDSMAAEIKELHGAISTLGRRTKRCALVAYAAVLLIVLFTATLTTFVGLGIITLASR